MPAPFPLLALLSLGCTPSPELAAASLDSEPEPAVTTSVGTRWKLIHQRSDGVAVRLGDTAHGVRIDLGEHPGLTPIAGGRSPERALGAPLLELPYPSRLLQSVSVTEQGIDLVVRFTGPPLNTMTRDPHAPADPVLTWVRVRDRGDTWRVAVEGIALWHLPEPVAVQHADREGVIVSTRGWGSWLLTSNAPAARSALTHAWTYDLRPSIEAREPYPITAATWSDLRLGPTPSRPPQ